MKYIYNVEGDSNEDDYDPKVRGYREAHEIRDREGRMLKGRCRGGGGNQGLSGMGVVTLMDTIPSTSSSES